MISYLRSLFIFFIVFHTLGVQASGYDDDVLDIYAKLMPRFVLMSSQKEKIAETINICLVSDSTDALFVASLEKKVHENYPNGIKNYQIHFIKTNYSQAKPCKNTQLIFLFDTHDEKLNTFLAVVNKYKNLTISYDSEVLQNGVDISLFLGRRVLPYLNMHSISKKGVQLNNILLRISKIYSQEDGL